MEDNSPISNIPLLFTQYRTRVLEESGQQWFHSENKSGEMVDSFTPSLESSGESLESTENSTTVPQTADIASNFEHPDPWASPPSNPDVGETLIDNPAHTQDAIVTTEISKPQEVSLPQEVNLAQDSAVMHVMLPNLDTAVPPSSDTHPLDALNAESTSDNSSTTVNLFPFENTDYQAPDTTKVYDLTEFDNGEIEVPPVAVRESQTARFETIHRSSSSIDVQDGEDESEDQTFIDPITQERIDPKNLSSAELAKYRLRNCL